MTWFKIDDGFSEHRKVDALGTDQPLAIAAWTLCGVTCARKLTDGFVSHADLARSLLTWSVKDRARAAEALVRVELWHEVEGGFQFHRWEDHQPSKAKVEATKADASRRKAAFDERRRNAPTPAPPERDGNALPPPTENAPPSRPVPTRPDPLTTFAVPRAGEAEAARVLVRLHRELVGSAWVSERQLLEALDGRGPLARGPHADHVRQVAAHFAEEADPIAAIESAMRGWAADPWVREREFPMAAFAKDPRKYLRARSADPDDFSNASRSTEAPF